MIFDTYVGIDWSGAYTAPVPEPASAWLLALGAGWWTLRGILRTPVVDTLRKASA